jgi:diaminohydroxyphosphoribosylaminopyrimidine deaminase/5-amino-6-(5-phosphoribosylamino)uracil reductase
MKMALRQAKKGLFTTTANPRVGCVLVSRGRIVGKGFHKRVGEPHAEVFAIENADEYAQGAIAFVTLEPCSHIGKNPPCADALIKAGVKKVIVCNEDSNPLVAGKGLEKLKAAGIRVKTGIRHKKGLQLNVGFFHRMKTGLPFVRLKMAQSLDGRTAMKNGDSHWITGKQARCDVQYWRARSHAVLTGIETVLLDDCRMTVRVNELPKKYKKLPNDFAHYQPMRVILDTQLKIPLGAKILSSVGRSVIMTASNDTHKIQQLQKQGVEVVQIPKKEEKLDLQLILKWLGDEQINELLVEAGATIAGAFMQQKLVNQLILYTAPVIMGSNARPLFEINIEEMNKRLHINNFTIKQMGKDWRLMANL